MNDSCCKTIVGGLFASYFLRQFDQDLHKLAYLRGNVHRKIRSQHGDIYCLALMFGSGLRSVAKPHRDLKVYPWKKTAFRLAQVSSGLPTEGGTLRWDSRYFGKMLNGRNIPCLRGAWRAVLSLFRGTYEVNLFCLSHCPNCETHAEEDRRGQKPRRFLEECQRFERVNDTSVGIPANRAITVKIKTHDFLAIHTPESYSHLVVSKFPRGFPHFSTNKPYRRSAEISASCTFPRLDIDGGELRDSSMYPLIAGTSSLA